MIDFACPKCGKMLHHPKTAAGHNIRCNGCHEPLLVPGIREWKFDPPGGEAAMYRRRILNLVTIITGAISISSVIALYLTRS